MTTSTPLAPVQPAERIQIVDILRGFALFGILFVNMTIFSMAMAIALLPQVAAISANGLGRQ